MKLVIKNFKKFIGVLLLIGVGCYFLVFAWLVYAVQIDRVVDSDAIFVLGAGAYKDDGTFNPCLQSRLDHAINLYNLDYADKLVFSGGEDEYPKAIEGEVMRDYAISKKVEPTDIIIETKSTSTYENILFSKPIMQANNIDSVIIVTEKFHSPRAGLVAKSQDLNYTLSPADSTCWSRWKYLSRYFLREPFVIVYYTLTNKISLL